MRRVLPTAVLAALACLWGCTLSPVKNGMDEMQVQARMGKPDTVHKNSDGSATWEYPFGPAGRQTYMVTVGPDHTVKDVRQVLSDEYFAQVRPGMSREQVRQLLGKPGDISVFSARDEEVWSWRYQQANPMFFNVLFDRSAGTVRTTQRLEEILFLDQDC
ncbi:MAG TPA: outer membrane protein assembly factor BamE [Burkholderiales bacterium]|nr:outer membrane protein assembly factor BamE [Burkholderiales bacterium]